MNGDDIDIGVGSTNPAKISAVRQGLGAWFDATVQSTDTESGVRAQPRSQRETITGARHRAETAFSELDVDLGVGVESGVTSMPGAEGTFLCMAAAATDGSCTEVGVGPAARLPDDIAAAVDDGTELGTVLREKWAGDPEADGTIGMLTDGAIDRTTALSTAVTLAVAPFVSNKYG